MHVSLVCHPTTPSTALTGITVAVERRPGGLGLCYVLVGDVAGLRTGAAGEPLWQHTCCEVFFGPLAAAAYREFNFSPAGEWAAYAFAGYRQAMPFEAKDPALQVRRSRWRLELAAQVATPRGPLRVGLSAVVEAADGTLSYWALRHPPGKPDFHHPLAFALEIADPAGEPGAASARMREN